MNIKKGLLGMCALLAMTGCTVVDDDTPDTTVVDPPDTTVVNPPSTTEIKVEPPSGGSVSTTGN